MALILHIETSAKRCSVAISHGKDLVSSEGITTDGYVHAEMLHVLIGNVLSHANISIRKLNAVGVSKGPGSYTGLRIGVSAAKGLCYALEIPLIAVDTTAVIADHAAQLAPHATQILAMIDARRMEVYCGIFNQHGIRMHPDQAMIVDQNFMDTYDHENTVFCGDGADKANQIGVQKSSLHTFIPSAEMMVSGVWEKFITGTIENTASFEPHYLKDYLPGITKKTLV